MKLKLDSTRILTTLCHHRHKLTQKQTNSDLVLTQLGAAMAQDTSVQTRQEEAQSRLLPARFNNALENKTTSLQHIVTVLNGIQQQQQKTVQKSNTATTTPTTDDKKDFQKEINLKCEVILSYDMETFNPKRTED